MSLTIENNIDVSVSGAGDSTIAAAQVQAGITNALDEVYSPAGIEKIDRALGARYRSRGRTLGRS